MKLTTLVLALLVSVFPFPSEALSSRALSSQQKPAAAPAKVTAQAQDLAAERRELAEIRLALGAERTYSDAKARLARLAATLGARSDAEARALLVDVQALEAEVRRALGEAPAQASGEDAIDVKVRDALLTNDYGFLLQLGRRAVPGLSEAVRRDPSRFPGDTSVDPLTHLVAIDPLATDRLCAELIGENGFLWKKRVMRILTPALIERRELWSADSPKRWLGGGFLATLEKYAEDEDVGNAALYDLAVLSAAGARSSALDGLLLRALRSSDPVRRQMAFDVIRQYGRRAGQPFLESLLAVPEEELRAFAADQLSVTRESEALLARADDPSASVRLALVGWLSKSDKGAWGTRERAALIRLLHDEAEFVRSKALEVVHDLPGEKVPVTLPAERGFGDRAVEYSRTAYVAPLPDEAFRDLAPDLVVRLVSVAGAMPAPQCYELIERSARAPAAVSPLFTEAMAKNRPGEFASALQGTPYWEDPRRALQTLGVIQDSGQTRDLSEHTWFLRQLCETRAGMSALLAWLIERPDDEAIRRLPSIVDPKGRLTGLEPELVARWVARLYRVSKESAYDASHLSDWTPELSAAFRALAHDGAQPVGLRALALEAALRREQVDEEFRAQALGLLEAPAWRAPEARGWDDGFLAGLIEDAPADLANAMILRALRDPGLPDELVVRAAEEIKSGWPSTGEVATLVIERSLGRKAWSQAAASATAALGATTLADPAVLERLASDPLHFGTGLRAIGRLRDPRSLPFLAEVVNAPMSAYHLRGAAQALCGYLDEGAVEPLLAAAARVEDAETRDQCLAQLEKIREYLDAKERWASGRVAERTRAEVVAELVAQLDAKSDDVKVEAMRALATWEALEAMPRLIELSASGSKPVAAAARAALEHLNARAPEKKD